MTSSQRNILLAAITVIITALTGVLQSGIFSTPTPVTADSTAVTITAPLSAIRADSFAYVNDSAFHANVASFIAGGTGVLGKAMYGDGSGANLAHLDTLVRYHNHATLRYDQPAGVASTPSLWVSFDTTGHRHIWYHTVIRFSPGWTTVGNGLTGCGTNADGTTKYCTSSAAYKLLGFAWAGYDGSGRVEITNTTEYQLYWGPTKNGTAYSVVEFGHGGSVGTEWTDGAWYNYIVEVDFTKKLGVSRLWIGKLGTTPVLRATSSSQMTDTTLMLPPLNRIGLGLNFNQVRTQAQALWYGQWEVIDGITHPNPYSL